MTPPFTSPTICCWHVTVVSPSGNVESEAGEQTTPPHAGDTVGGGYVTIAPPDPGGFSTAI